MEPFTIRRAGPADADALARLRFRFRTEIKRPAESEEAFARRCGDWMARRLAADGLWRCWLAESPSGMLGHAWLQIWEKLPNPVGEPEWYGYVTNLYVVPDLRGGGVGGKLLEAAIEECRTGGVDTVILWPTPKSRSLYLRHGFTEADDVLALYLSSETH